MRSSFIVAVALVLAGLSVAGCSESAAETVGSPCTRTKDCEALTNGYCAISGVCTRACTSHDDCGCSSSTTLDGQDTGQCYADCLGAAAGGIAGCKAGCGSESDPAACEAACDADAARACDGDCQGVTTNDDIQAGRCGARCAIFKGDAGYCVSTCTGDKDCEGDLSCTKSGPEDAKESIGSCL